MDSVKKAKQRFRNYPLVFGKCRKEASVYAQCVLKLDNVNKNSCSEEFIVFTTCLRKAAASMNTRL